MSEENIESPETIIEPEAPESQAPAQESVPQAPPAPEQTELSNIKAALKEERERRYAEQARSERMEKAFQKAVEMQMRQSGQKEEKPEPVQLPDASEDPFGHLYGKISQLEKQLAKQYESVESENQQRQAHNTRQALITEYQNQAQKYAAQNPEFGQAYTALYQNRIEELQSMGYDYSSANDLAQQEEIMLAGQMLTQGINPAERLFELAKRRGLVKPASSTGNQAPRNTQQMLEAAEAANSLAGTSGGTAQTGITLEQLSRLKEGTPEFEKGWNEWAKTQR